MLSIYLRNMACEISSEYIYVELRIYLRSTSCFSILMCEILTRIPNRLSNNTFKKCYGTED